MKRALLYIGILLSFFSCHEEGAEMDVFRAEVYEELSIEAELHLVDESWEEANKYRTRNKRRNFGGLDRYHEKLDSLLDLYETCKVHLMDSLALVEFERNYLTLLFNYKHPRRLYAYPENGQDLSTMNPSDTSDFRVIKGLLSLILNRNLSEDIRQIHLTELISQGLTIQAYRLPQSSFDFYSIELLANSPQNIWKKGEKGYLVVDYYSVDAKHNTTVKIEDELFDEKPVTIKAPKEKGLHEIKGVYYMKEAGIEVAKPFTYRILVE